MPEAQNNPWRDKYRRALTQQENLEQSLSAYQSILKRVVLSLSNAAQGRDDTLDERLQAIIASAKNNDVAGFDRMIKSLDRVVEEAGQRQQIQWREAAKLFSEIANRIQQFSPDASLKPAVKQFKKQLPKDAELIPSTLKRQLKQLFDLHQMLLDQSPKESGGLLKRWFGGESSTDQPVEATSTEALQNEVQGSVEEAEWEDIDEAGAISGDDILEGELSDEASTSSVAQQLTSLTQVVSDNSVSDASFQHEVPERATDILLELLAHFKSLPATEQKAKTVRQRVEAGLQWHDLAPTLEDLKDFMLLTYLGIDEDYQHYLKKMDQQLAELLEALGVSVTAEEVMRNRADTLHTQISQGVDDIYQALSLETDTPQLKIAVSTQLEKLQDALKHYQQPMDSSESGADSLSLQLQSLVEKVKSMEQDQASMNEHLEEARQKAITDPLTGLPNRQAYTDRVYQEMQRWQRYNHPLTLAVADIDFFKKINDNYGHQIGDKVLKIVSSTIAKQLREVDFIARFGGEEFVVILPETTGENATILLNRIREGIANAPFKYKDQKVSITISIGIAEFLENDHSELVFERADKALYIAKDSGRNCCILADNPS